MKHRQKATYFLAGILAALLITTLVSPAMAALTDKTIQVRGGVGIYIDGQKLNPTDVNGNPVDTFIYNGTTYVPIRAVSTAFGKSIRYDSPTQSVYIGKEPGSTSYLLTVCPPYQTYCYAADPTYTIMGKKYANGFTLGMGGTSGNALFNLNGDYETLSFDIGHIDGRSGVSGAYDIYLDGELALSVDLDGEMRLEHYELPLDGALQMKVEARGGWLSIEYNYAMCNIQVT
ncbi:MAG: copper amine oxidase N-terminal domain-containing protein [Dysosmobacter sp.]|nr:copper amine oxidase N-terminal domain-containing protein [Dysosmobacter sp.]